MEETIVFKAMLVDDELPALEELEYLLKGYPLEIAAMIQDARTVLSQVELIKPDVIFLDIDMPGVNGLELAVKIQELQAGICIIFVTAYSEYALDAFRAYPLDYIMKPVNEKRFAQTMQHLFGMLENKKPDLASGTITHIRCFGNFGVYIENGERRTMKFATKQAREMFAYLICHFEKHISRQELINVIFGGTEDKKTVNLLHVTAYKLRHAMEEAGIGRNSITISGNYSLKAAEGVCDYIDFNKFIDHNPYIDKANIASAEHAAGLYQGVLLENEEYLWAEETKTEMELRFENLLLGISSYYYEAEKFHNCEKALVSLIKYDPYSETGNRALLNLYMKYSDPEKYREHYEKYAALLEKEFQIAPDKKYKEYYLKLIK